MNAGERDGSLSPVEAFAVVQAHCLSKDGAAEDYPWDHCGWKVKGKLFCIGTKDHNVFTLKSTPEKQLALIQHPRISVAAYVGRYGWVTFEVVDEDDRELALELIDESYDLVAKKKTTKKST